MVEVDVAPKGCTKGQGVERLRQYYADKYDAKLQENQMLSEKLALLQDEYTKVLDASDKQLGSPVDSEPKVHGNIKVKRKKKTVAEIKADIKGKTE